MHHKAVISLFPTVHMQTGMGVLSADYENCWSTATASRCCLEMYTVSSVCFARSSCARQRVRYSTAKSLTRGQQRGEVWCVWWPIMIALCVMWQGDVEEDESVPDKESDILLRNHSSGGQHRGAVWCVWWLIIIVLCVMWQGDVEEDESVPDKESDIRPRFYRPRTRSIEHMGDDVSVVLSLSRPQSDPTVYSVWHYTDDARLWVWHWNMMTLAWKCRTLAHICFVVWLTTHTRLTALCSGLPRWAVTTRKVKPIWILLKQETVSGSGTRHHSVFYRPDALPDAQPTASNHWRPNCMTNH